MVKTIASPQSSTYILKPESQLTHLAEKTKGEYSIDIEVVFIPTDVTPLDQYEKELLDAGMPQKHIKEIIDGLADSPLYESKTTNPRA